MKKYLFQLSLTLNLVLAVFLIFAQKNSLLYEDGKVSMVDFKSALDVKRSLSGKDFDDYNYYYNLGIQLIVYGIYFHTPPSFEYARVSDVVAFYEGVNYGKGKLSEIGLKGLEDYCKLKNLPLESFKEPVFSIDSGYDWVIKYQGLELPRHILKFYVKDGEIVDQHSAVLLE